MRIIRFNAMKALGNVQTHGKCRIRLTIAKNKQSLAFKLVFFVKTTLNELKRVISR